MKFFLFLFSLCANILAEPSESSTSLTISIQPLSPIPITPEPLAEILYDPHALSSTLHSFSLPFSPSDSPLFRIGVYSPSTSTWISSTSLTSSETFDKGYRQILIISLDARGDVLSVSCKSERIDAGQTRDFGPSVVVRAMERGKRPVLNRPVVLSHEGKLPLQEVEKTLLQKYWWVGLGVLMLVMTAGGGAE